jgi:hypothetical protein
LLERHVRGRVVVIVVSWELGWKRMSRCFVIHAGTNNIRHGTSAIEIRGDTLDLVYCIRKEVPSTKIVISRVLYRRNTIITL